MFIHAFFTLSTGDEEVFGVNQTNKTEDDNPKKWAATSILDYTFHKGLNGKALKCVAVHEAYPTKSRDSQVFLDVQCKYKIEFCCLKILGFTYFKPFSRSFS